MNHVLPSENVTIMFVDLVGYTKTTNHMDRENLNRLHDVFDTLCLPLFKHYGGRVIKKIGDAFLTAFKSPTNALLCGVDLQETFSAYNKHYKLYHPLQIRVAVHNGEVISRNDDLYGDAVNVASRIEGIAKGGDVVFSEAVFSNMNKNEIPSVYLGVYRLRGIKLPLKLFRVTKQYDKILKKKRIRRKQKKRIMETIIILVFMGLLAFAGYYLIRYLTTRTIF